MSINEIILSRDIANKIRNHEITHYISLNNNSKKEFKKGVNYSVKLGIYGKIENLDGNNKSGHLEPCFDLYDGEEYIDSFTIFML